MHLCKNNKFKIDKSPLIKYFALIQVMYISKINRLKHKNVQFKANKLHKGFLK